MRVRVLPQLMPRPPDVMDALRRTVAQEKARRVVLGHVDLANVHFTDRAHVVLLWGPAGVGKSLAAGESSASEVLQREHSRARRCRRGRCF